VAINTIEVMGSTTAMLRVRRRCLVCEGENVFEEEAGMFAIGTPCPECHAPTERIEVLERRSVRTNRNPNAAALGRLGGLKGGPARARALSADRRRDIATRAARARWGHRRATRFKKDR
jgi:hypothetical protein